MAAENSIRPLYSRQSPIKITIKKGAACGFCGEDRSGTNEIFSIGENSICFSCIRLCTDIVTHDKKTPPILAQWQIFGEDLFCPPQYIKTNNVIRLIKIIRYYLAFMIIINLAALCFAILR